MPNKARKRSPKQSAVVSPGAHASDSNGIPKLEKELERQKHGVSTHVVLLESIGAISPVELDTKKVGLYFSRPGGKRLLSELCSLCFDHSFCSLSPRKGSFVCLQQEK